MSFFNLETKVYDKISSHFPKILEGVFFFSGDISMLRIYIFVDKHLNIKYSLHLYTSSFLRSFHSLLSNIDKEILEIKTVLNGLLWRTGKSTWIIHSLKGKQMIHQKELKILKFSCGECKYTILLAWLTFKRLRMQNVDKGMAYLQV